MEVYQVYSDLKAFVAPLQGCQKVWQTCKTWKNAIYLEKSGKTWKSHGKVIRIFLVQGIVKEKLL